MDISLCDLTTEPVGALGDQVYLSVGLGDLLVQTLVAVDGELQLLHLGRQPTFTADFTPGLHLGQELRNKKKYKKILHIFACMFYVSLANLANIYHIQHDFFFFKSDCC